MALTPGTMLGPYTIGAPLGAGGMGEVYRARDSRLGREIALKVIPESFAQDPERLARFEREARTVAALNHPGIVTIHSIEEFGGTRVLTMELVEGQSLDRVIVGGGLPADRLLALTRALAEALAAAHGRGVIHRDLKPANVMVTSQDRIKVLDFGLARGPAVLAGADGEPPSELPTLTGLPLSMPGVVMGTLSYMAPEQLRGEPLDERADLFALGIILYEMATGRHPFAGASVVDVTSAILRDTPVPIGDARPDLPAAFADIVATCLMKAREQRTCTAQVAHDRLGETLRGTPTAPPEVAAPAIELSSIAVLPFANHSASTDEYFSDGLADQLINLLSKIDGLRVAARTSAFRFKGAQMPIGEIGDALKVGTVLEGSVRKGGDRVRVTVQLVNTRDGYSLWSETYDRTMDDIFAVQDDIAEQVVRALRPRLAPAAAGVASSGGRHGAVVRAAIGRGSNVEAHRLLLLARHFLSRYTEEDTRTAKMHLLSATELDAHNALAWVELSRASSREAFLGWAPLAECVDRAREAAERALAIEPDLAEAHAELGRIRTNFDWDWTGANAALRRALALGPGIALTHQLAAALAFDLGRLDEAIEHCRRATEQDALNVAAHHTLGAVLRAADRLPEAEAALRTVIELNPQKFGVQADLALTLAAQGRAREALDMAASDLFKPLSDWALALIYGDLGQRSAADEAFARLLEQSADCAYQIAEVYASRGEFERTLEWLELAFEQRDGGVTQANVSPRLRAFRRTPAGIGFLRKMKFVA